MRKFGDGGKFAILLLVGGVLFSSLYLGSLSRWWYEDDPLQFHYVREIDNPAAIVTDPGVLRGFAVGRALVPLQLVSYWTDIRLFGVSPQAAYLHSLISMLATMVMLYVVLLRWTQNLAAACGGALLWLLAPSTMVVHQFLATRHYMEGLFFGLFSVYWLDWLREERKKTDALIIVAAVFCGVIAMLFKEIYGAMVPAYFLMAGLYRRRREIAVLAILMMVSYFAYRVWMVGTDVSYTMPFLGPLRYIRFLLRMPYMISANHAGYVLFVVFLVVTRKLMKQHPEDSKPQFVLFLILIGAAFAAVYPVSFAVLMSYKTPSTWYRVPFIFNTLFVIWLTYAAVRLRRVTAVFIVAFLIILPGTEKTRRYWAQHMDRAKAEAMFYMANPDKLLYSEEQAYWFIPGVNALYEIPREHFINKHEKSAARDRAMLAAFPTIWRYQDGQFRPDADLFRTLQAENTP